MNSIGSYSFLHFIIFLLGGPQNAPLMTRSQMDSPFSIYFLCFSMINLLNILCVPSLGKAAAYLLIPIIFLQEGSHQKCSSYHKESNEFILSILSFSASYCPISSINLCFSKCKYNNVQ